MPQAAVPNPLLYKLPKDFGFDEKRFPAYRANQLDKAVEIAESGKPLFLLEAPTGSGKSLLGITSHKILKEPRTAYIVSTKQLQDQIVGDFDLPILKGRNNYPCLHFPQLFPEVTSEICHDYLAGEECDRAGRCPYVVQKRIALSAPICILNYPLFLTEANFVGGFSDLGFLILDEVDTAEDHLMSFIEVPITKRLIGRFNLSYPRFKTKLESWVDWVEKSNDIIEKALNKMGPPDPSNLRQIRELTSLRRVKRRLEFLEKNLYESWVFEQGGEDSEAPVVFKPVKVSGFAQSFIWKHTKRTLGMSATVMGPQAMAIDLGLHSWDVDSTSLPSPFPVENRQVKYVPVASVTNKTKAQAYPEIVKAIEGILDKYPKDKVLTHTVSYDLRNYIIDNLKPLHHQVISHDTRDRNFKLDLFKTCDYPAIMVSPSMDRGVDLPGGICKVIIVAKVPYPNLGSPQVNKRLHAFSDGPLWYARRTARTLVQMTGRATRRMGDWSVSYILDSQFAEFVGRNGHIFPNWWRESVSSGSI